MITGQVEDLNWKRCKREILDITVIKNKNKDEAALLSSSRLLVYELSMFRVAHLSGEAGGRGCRPVKYAANIMQLSCKEALGFNSLHEATF